MNGKRLRYWLAGVAACLVVVLALGQGVMSASDIKRPAPASPAAAVPPAGGSGDAPELVAQAAPAAETTTTTTTTRHGGWTVTCRVGGDPAQKRCSAEFRVVSKENNNALVLAWLLGHNAEGRLLAEFVTPTDILIRPGVAVSFNDGKALRAEFVSCTSRQGCRASMELTPKITRNLKSAAKARIGFTLLNGKVMEVGVDIPGVDLALADLGAEP